MATYTKVLLSASGQGKQIGINQSTSPGVTLHTAVSGTFAMDEVWLRATNNGSTTLPVVVCWGGTNPQDIVTTNVQAGVGPTLIADGKLLQAANVVSVYVPGVYSTAIVMDGYVNRISSDIDIRVQDWVNRVVLNGGAVPSTNTQQVLTQFVQGLEFLGLLSKMVMVNCFVPDSLIACLTPLIRGAGYDSWINHNFVSGDVTSNGITGDGSTKYADTGIQSSSAFNGVTTSVGLTLYCYLNPNSLAGNEEDLLAYDSGTNQLALLVTFNGVSYFDPYSENVGGGRVSIANSGFRGYISGNYGSLDGSVKEAIYSGSPLFGGHKTLVTDVSSTAGAVSNFKLFFGTGNQSGTPVSTSYSKKTYSFAAVHLGLKSAESQNLYNLVQTMRQGLGGGYINASAGTDWANRVVINGGAMPSSTTIAALDVFFATLVNSGLINKMLMINVVAPDSLTAALTPFWNYGGGIDPWINHNFVSGDLTVNGLIGNGSTKYLDTGFIPSISFASNTNGGFTVYTTVNTTNTTDADFYCAQSASQASGLLVNQGSGASGSSFLDAYSQTPGAGRISASNALFKGYLSGNAGTLGGGVIAAIYAASSGLAHNTLVSSTTSTGGTRPTISLYAFADNNAGSPALFTNKRYSFFATHAGLTSAESQTFYNAIQALRTAFGGGFI